MDADFSQKDIMPYVKKRKKRSGNPKIFLLILVVAAVVSLSFVIYRSGRELFSFFSGEKQTEQTTSSAETTVTEQTTLEATSAPAVSARRILKTDMSAFTLGKLYENETDADAFPSSYVFSPLSGSEISVIVICSRGFETYLAGEALYMDGDYPNGEQTVSADVCARNIAANLTLSGIGAIYIDVGNTSAYKSYENAVKKINECLALYPNVKCVIDVHRGVYYDGEGNFIAPTFAYGGGEAAQMRFEVGAGSENFALNLSVADTLFTSLQKEDRLSVMPTRIKSGKLASDVSVPVITLEIGSAVTPAENALTAAELFAKIFAQTAG